MSVVMSGVLFIVLLVLVWIFEFDLMIWCIFVGFIFLMICDIFIGSSLCKTWVVVVGERCVVSVLLIVVGGLMLCKICGVSVLRNGFMNGLLYCLFELGFIMMFIIDVVSVWLRIEVARVVCEGDIRLIFMKIFVWLLVFMGWIVLWSFVVVRLIKILLVLFVWLNLMSLRIVVVCCFVVSVLNMCNGSDGAVVIFLLVFRIVLLVVMILLGLSLSICLLLLMIVLFIWRDVEVLLEWLIVDLFSFTWEMELFFYSIESFFIICVMGWVIVLELIWWCFVLMSVKR